VPRQPASAPPSKRPRTVGTLIPRALRSLARLIAANWRRSSASRLGLIGGGALALIVVVAAAAPWLAPYDPHAQTGVPFASPSSAHLLGTDDVGHDLLSQLMYGARVSLLIGFLAAFISIFIGSAVGVVSGYFRGFIDATIMRAVDVVLALPFLPLLIVLAAFLGRGLATIIFVISAVTWAWPARVVRSQVLSVRERGDVQASRAMGARTTHLLLRHVLPSVSPLIIAQFVGAARFAILLEASLSFLGLGDPTTISWGTILYYASARGAFLTGAWLWWVVPTGLLIAIVVLGFAFVGFALEERADPRLRSGGPSLAQFAGVPFGRRTAATAGAEAAGAEAAVP